MTSVPFLTDDGEVVLDDVEVRLDGERAHIDGVVSAATWAHIVDRDVFSAGTRTPDGVLVSDPTPVRLSLTGAEESLGGGEQPRAAEFVIVQAERRLTGAPDDGEVWVGVTYSDGDDFAAAVDMLAELGFSGDGGAGTSRSFSSVDGATVVLAVDRDASLATVVVSTPVGAVADEHQVLRLLNGFNAGFPAGSLSLVSDGLRVAEAFPVLDGTPVASTLEALAGGLVGLAQMVADVIPAVADGSTTADDALARFFG